MSQNNEVRQALAFVENAVDALSDVSLQAAATALAAEVRRLRAVNQTINAIWEDVDAYARKHPEISWGDRVAQHALKLMKERDALAAELAKLRSAEGIIVNLEHLLQQSLETIETLNGEVMTLKLERSRDCRTEAKLFLEALDALNALEKTKGWAGMGGHVGSTGERLVAAECMHKARRALEVKLNNPDGPRPPPKKR